MSPSIHPSPAMSLKNKILIATPSITDAHFQGSVVLMIEDGPQGSIGLTLNKPSPLACDVVLKELSLSWQAPQPNLLIGGPVYPETLWLLHSGRSGQADLRITEGLVLNRSREGLAAVCAADERDARLYFGCAGWKPRQLLGEMSRGDWWVGEVSPELIFGLRYDEVWAEALRSLGVDPLGFVGEAWGQGH